MQLNVDTEQVSNRKCDTCANCISWTEYGAYFIDCNVGNFTMPNGTKLHDRFDELEESGDEWVDVARECPKYEEAGWVAEEQNTGGDEKEEEGA